MAEQTPGTTVIDPSGNYGPTEHGDIHPDEGSRRMLTSAVWGNVPMFVSSENGMDVTPWNPDCSWYQYGTHYCLNGCQHPGMDISMVEGTALFAAAGGQVVFSGNDGFYAPLHVNILAANGEVHIYGHLSSIDPNVFAGAHVQAGQFLGGSGSMNGGHLHFERRVPNGNCGSGFSADDPTSVLTDAPQAGDQPVPQAGFAAGDRINVVDPPLRFRDGPGTGSNVIEELPLGTELCVVGGPQQADGYDWYQVSRPESGAQGWVAGSFCGLVAAQGCQ